MPKAFSGWMILLLCLTLGLAPFFPEPHIVADLRWIAGGANGMTAMNWFDTALHGFPWLLGLGWIGNKIIRRFRTKA
jgi:hypothetical protein